MNTCAAVYSRVGVSTRAAGWRSVELRNRRAKGNSISFDLGHLLFARSGRAVSSDNEQLYPDTRFFAENTGSTDSAACPEYVLRIDQPLGNTKIYVFHCFICFAFYCALDTEFATCPGVNAAALHTQTLRGLPRDYETANANFR